MPGDDRRPKVAYFCMEYGLNKEMRTYGGGLGILAGDILKAAKEENLPMVGVGIFWRPGYIKQLMDENGNPYDCYPTNDYMYDFMKDIGVTVKVDIRNRDVQCKVWKIDKYNNVPLYLLDTNLPQNSDRWITGTGQLYGWFEEERIAQEIVLGIGGVRALEKLNIKPDVYHFNEDHAILAGTELIRKKMEQGLSFDDAWEKAREKIVFTTHTPVQEGNETHDLETMKYMGAFNNLISNQMIKIGWSPF